MLLAWYAVQGLLNDPVSVRLSVPSIDHCSSVQQAGDTDRQRRAHSSTTFSSTAHSNKCEQCRVYSRRLVLSGNVLRVKTSKM